MVKKNRILSNLSKTKKQKLYQIIIATISEYIKEDGKTENEQNSEIIYFGKILKDGDYIERETTEGEKYFTY